MPTTIVAVLVLLTAVAPGLAFVGVTERRTPLKSRSQTREVAELVVVGAASTTFVAAALLSVHFLATSLGLWRPLSRAGVTSFVNQPALRLMTHPEDALLAAAVLTVVLSGSWFVARAAALVFYRDRKARIDPNSTVWYKVLGREGNDVYATVQLKDGRRIKGYVGPFDTGLDGEAKDLSLRSDPDGQYLRMSPSANEPYTQLPNRSIVINGSEIATIVVKYLPR